MTSDIRYFDVPPAHARATFDGTGPVNAFAVRWSGSRDVPAVGDIIDITCNRIGAATVTGYFVQLGWLGIVCTLHNPPRGKCATGCHVFGAEIA